MQLNCKVIKKWQPPLPISISTPPFQGYQPFLAIFLVPSQVTRFLEGATPPPPLIKRGGSNYDTTWQRYNAFYKGG